MRQAEQAAAWADSKTRAPRVVRLSVNEARTIDSKPFQRQNYCVQCGHLPMFHTIGTSAFCTVDDCECDTEDLDAREQERLALAEHAWLYRKAYSRSRWIVPLATLVIGIILGAVLH